MGRGISEVLTFAIGVAISPIPIIAVILMLFSQRARVNGPVFLLGWVGALTIVSGVVYVISDQGNAATNSSSLRRDLVVERSRSALSSSVLAARPMASAGRPQAPRPRCRSGCRG